MAAEAGVPAFEAAALRYIEDQKAAWTNEKHGAQWLASLKAYALPFIGGKRVDAITTADAMAILRPIWNSKTETANRVRQRCERILDAEAVKGHRSGENPFRWRGHLDALLPRPKAVSKPKHFAALPYKELPSLMFQLRQQPHLSARALEFTILTVARTSMTTGARLDEFNGPMTIWTVPPERMKGKRENRREHLVPIIAYARELVRGIDREPGEVYVFPGQRGGHLSDAAMLEYLEHVGYGHVTVHGFRSTFKDWAAETTGFANEASEAALAHAIPDKTEAAYRRGQMLEKRRRLMESWGRYCLGRK
jgi:integrase